MRNVVVLAEKSLEPTSDMLLPPAYSAVRKSLGVLLSLPFTAVPRYGCMIRADPTVRTPAQVTMSATTIVDPANDRTAGRCRPKALETQKNRPHVMRATRSLMKPAPARAYSTVRNRSSSAHHMLPT